MPTYLTYFLVTGGGGGGGVMKTKVKKLVGNHLSAVRGV